MTSWNYTQYASSNYDDSDQNFSSTESLLVTTQKKTQLKTSLIQQICHNIQIVNFLC